MKIYKCPQIYFFSVGWMLHRNLSLYLHFEALFECESAHFGLVLINSQQIRAEIQTEGQIEALKGKLGVEPWDRCWLRGTRSKIGEI